MSGMTTRRACLVGGAAAVSGCGGAAVGALNIASGVLGLGGLLFKSRSAGVLASGIGAVVAVIEGFSQLSGYEVAEVNNQTGEVLAGHFQAVCFDEQNRMVEPRGQVLTGVMRVPRGEFGLGGATLGISAPGVYRMSVVIWSDSGQNYREIVGPNILVCGPGGADVAQVQARYGGESTHEPIYPSGFVA